MRADRTIMGKLMVALGLETLGRGRSRKVFRTQAQIQTATRAAMPDEDTRQIRRRKDIEHAKMKSRRYHVAQRRQGERNRPRPNWRDSMPVRQ